MNCPNCQERIAPYWEPREHFQHRFNAPQCRNCGAVVSGGMIIGGQSNIIKPSAWRVFRHQALRPVGKFWRWLRGFYDCE